MHGPRTQNSCNMVLSLICNMFYCCVLTFNVSFRDLAGRHVAQAQLMQSCLAAVKASMLVVQRSQEPISTAVLSASDNQSDLHPALSGLLNCYTCILTDGKAKTLCFLFIYTFLYTVFITVDFFVLHLSSCLFPI